MGSFANSVFIGLLGWFQILVSDIWSNIINPGSSSFFSFLSENWIILAAGLCLAGLITDFIVYLYRWTPYKVWNSFFHRFRNAYGESKEKNDNFSANKEDASCRQDDGGSDNHQRNTDQMENSPAFNQYSTISGGSNQLLNGENSFMKRSIQPRRRRNLMNNLFGTSEEDSYVFQPPKLSMDQKDAYNLPVYPKNWTNSGEDKG